MPNQFIASSREIRGIRWPKTRIRVGYRFLLAMGLLKVIPSCSQNQHCAQWARTYLKYCLCNTNDYVALGLGLVSVLSWGVAEVPQIIANCKEKSTEGLSIAFLMTWIVGDLFNLVGCMLEPATLPTQFYMALFYTVNTVVLTAQTIYYGHIYHRLKADKISKLHKRLKLQDGDSLTKERLLYRIDEKEANGPNIETAGLHIPSSPIPVTAQAISSHSSAGRDLYYTSARSLSTSPVPTAGTLSAYSRDSGREPLLSSLGPTQSAPPSLTTKNMLCVVSLAAFLLCTYRTHLSMAYSLNGSHHGTVIMVGRRLLQSKDPESAVGHGGGETKIGTILGWAMAAIYMGGRLPQISLNIRRGNMEGLSPLMFFFALIGNSTYVGSILVKNIGWSAIRPNMPWLVDAGGCALLDAFILVQFVYFRYWKTDDVENRDDS